MNAFGSMSDAASQILAKHALDEVNALAAGAGDNTEVDGLTISLIPADMPNRPRSVAFLIWFRATLAAAATLSLEYTLQYRTGASTWNDITGRANIANASIATGGGGGTTEKGVFKTGLDLSRIPDTANAVRIQVKPDLSAGGTDTATLTGIAVFGGLQTTPQS